MRFSKVLSIAAVIAAASFAPVAANAVSVGGSNSGKGGFEVELNQGNAYGKPTEVGGNKFGLDNGKGGNPLGDRLAELLDKKQGGSKGGWEGPKQGGGASPVPLPATLPLLIGGIGAISVIRSRRKA
jgi:hypothetical protein